MKITYLICLILSSTCLEISANLVKSRSENHVAKAEPIDYEMSCGVSNYNPDRRAGEETAQPNEFPWIASIQLYRNEKYEHHCGGAVVHSKFILTAKYCDSGYPVNMIFVAVGIFRLYTHEDHEQMREVVKVWDYNEGNGNIALLELKEHLNLESGYIVPGCLPIGNEKFLDNAVAAGWGRLSLEEPPPKEMQIVILPLYDLKNCTKFFNDRGLGFILRDGCQLCTHDEKMNICWSDMGGPLMCINKEDGKPYICGIERYTTGCDDQNFPGIYTEVACYTEWITRIIKDNK